MAAFGCKDRRASRFLSGRREEASVSQSAGDFNSVRRRVDAVAAHRPRPRAGVQSAGLRGAGAPAAPPTPCPAPPGSPPTTSSRPAPEASTASTPAAVSAAPVLGLSASVAPRQDMRLHHGRVYLQVGCDVATRWTRTGIRTCCATVSILGCVAFRPRSSPITRRKSRWRSYPPTWPLSATPGSALHRQIRSRGSRTHQCEQQRHKQQATDLRSHDHLTYR